MRRSLLVLGCVTAVTTGCLSAPAVPRDASVDDSVADAGAGDDTASDAWSGAPVDAAEDAAGGDTGPPCQPGFTVLVDPPLGTWTPEYLPQTACDCSASQPSCHATYAARPVSLAGHLVALEGRKVASQSVPGPSVSVASWVVGSPTNTLHCGLLDSYPVLWRQPWPARAVAHATVPAWPSAEALVAAPCGDVRRLAFVSGGSDAPEERRWFQRDAIRVQKVCSCAPPAETASGTLWGIGEPVVWNTLAAAKGWPLDEQIAEIAALHPEVVRLWMDAGHVLSAPTVARDHNVALYRSAISGLQDTGAVVVVMDSGFVEWMTGVEEHAVPCPSADQGSPYQRFLSAWEESWRTKATLFPEVRHWEVGNEWNSGAPFLYPSSGCDADGELSPSERVRVAADLMFRGKRGIDAGAPGATVFMAGLSPHEPAAFLEGLYGFIASGDGPSTDPRDYFDGAAWHPYTNDAPGAAWVAWNVALHDVLVAHGDGRIPVFFSEVGFTDAGFAETRVVHADWLLATVDEVRSELPWVWGVAWFRAFDDPTFGLGHRERGFGLMEAPPTYAWKPSAYAFSSVTAPPLAGESGRP